jgi:hypothetical protein
MPGLSAGADATALPSHTAAVLADLPLRSLREGEACMSTRHI